jgi:O-antigen/teichoic acid export membrane protein
MNMVLGITKLLNGSSLKAKCARGATTLAIGSAGGRGLRFLRVLILARILAPEQFGIIAIVIASLRLLEAFVEVGVKQAVIQNKRGADREYLNVAWWFQSLRGLALFAIAILLAPWISSFYGKPEFLRLFQVSYLSILFTSFISPRVYVLEKEYKFGWSVFLNQGSGILGTVITIVAAFILRNVWALVIGFVAEAAILCLLSYLLVPFLPRLSIDRECLRELMKFARGMFGLPILTWISLGVDVLVLGKFVADEMLGMYSLASQLVSLPAIFFAEIINPILLPGFAQKQDDRNALCRAVLQIARGVATFTAPLAVLLASCASGILLLAYGSQYVAVAVPCGIWCLLILVRVEAVIPAALYLAVGRPQLHRQSVILRAVVIVALIYPAIVHFGLSGAAAVMVLGHFAALLMQVFQCRRVIDLKFGDYIRSYVPGALLALPVIVVVSSLRLFGVESPVLVLIAGSIALVAAYAGYLAKISLSKCNEIPFADRKGPTGTLDFTAPTEAEDA